MVLPSGSVDVIHVDHLNAHRDFRRADLPDTI